MSSAFVDSSHPLARRSSSGQGVPPKVVVVKANSSSIEYSNSPSTKHSSHPNGTEEAEERGFVTIRNSTIIEFQFDGAGIIVLGAKHNKFPPIPDSYLPRWNCFVDNVAIENLNSSLPTKSKDEGYSIPADGNDPMCEAKSLVSGPHNLTIDIQVPHIPAFFHSIRYLPGQSNPHLNNVILRIDRRDNSSVRYVHGNWTHPDSNTLELDKDKGQLNITFHGHTLKWFGTTSTDVFNNLSFALDGKPAQPYYDKNKFSPCLVIQTKTKDNQNHTLSVSRLRDPASTLHGNMTLDIDRFEVYHGHPISVNAVSPSNPPPPGPPKAVIAGSIIAGVFGLVLSIILAIVLIGCRRKRRRRKMDNWKDSTLPSAIVHPASRVSSRSSFSEEVVTGDIEYNPEAQKKMECTQPPATIIVHADSGVRLQSPLRTSEIPPTYTQH